MRTGIEFAIIGFMSIGLHLPAITFCQTITLTWSANPEKDVASYAIYKGPQPNPTSQIAQVPTSENTYVDSDIALGNLYYYRVTAVDSAGNVSGFSQEILVSSDVITGVELASFSAQNVDGKVVLSWVTASDTGSGGFEVERKFENEAYKKIDFVASLGEPGSYTWEDAGASTAGAYYYRLKQVDLQGGFNYSEEISVSVGIPKEFELSQNHPNPFNPETTFTYSVSSGSELSIIIYDLLGKQVQTLVREFKQPGRYQIKWNGTDDNSQRVASGIYFARLSVGKFSQVRKILLQK
jgi:hypothetical protein